MSLTAENKLREYIRTFVRELLSTNEITQTGDIAGYNTPFAFSSKKKKDKDKEEEVATNSTGYEVVKESKERKVVLELPKKIYGGIRVVFNTKKEAEKYMEDHIPSEAWHWVKITSKMVPVNEGRYHQWRNDDTLNPKQKIGMAMRETRDCLKDLERTVQYNVRLKNELNVDSRDYWKTTHKALGKISERLVKLANKVGKLY